MSLIIKDGIKYASGTNLVELTQAQYDQLTSAQKNNGNFYLISDAPCSAFSLSNMEDVKLTSTTAGQGLQFAMIGGELKLVNTSRNVIKHTQVSGTTDGTGDLLITSLPLANYQIISAYKNRSISGEGAIGYCILGGNNMISPYIHLIKSDNTNLATTAVTLEIYYVEI